MFFRSGSAKETRWQSVVTEHINVELHTFAASCAECVATVIV